MNTPPNNLVLFLGHFHPLLVHLPIGGLVLLGILELLSRYTRWKEAAHSNRWILAFSCAGALAAAACGWMLAQSGGYDPQLLRWHRLAAIGVLVSALAAFCFQLMQWPRAYHITLAVTLIALVVAGHLGGSITHGRDFLVRYAPGPWHKLLGPGVAGKTAGTDSWVGVGQPVFAAVIEPILQRRCVTCHGAEKHKADLRLDSLEALQRGGQDGPVIKPGQASQSPLIQCLVSAPDADGHMPPEDQGQPTPQEIALLKWWVDAGAADIKTAGDLGLEPRLRSFQPPMGKSSVSAK